MEGKPNVNYIEWTCKVSISEADMNERHAVVASANARWSKDNHMNVIPQNLTDIFK